MKEQDNQAQYTNDIDNGHYVSGNQANIQGEVPKQEPLANQFVNKVKNAMPKVQMKASCSEADIRSFEDLPQYPTRKSSIKKTIGISIALSLLIGFVGGLIVSMDSNKAPNEAEIEQRIAATFEAQKKQLQTQMAGNKKAAEALLSYQLAFSKDEAIKVLDAKMNKLQQNIKQAKQNITSDNSIKTLNPKLYGELLQTIEQDGQKQLGDLRKARDVLAGLQSIQTQPDTTESNVVESEPDMPVSADYQMPQPTQEQAEQIQSSQAESQAHEVVEENMLEDAIFSAPSVAETNANETQTASTDTSTTDNQAKNESSAQESTSASNETQSQPQEEVQPQEQPAQTEQNQETQAAQIQSSDENSETPKLPFN